MPSLLLFLIYLRFQSVAVNMKVKEGQDIIRQVCMGCG